MKYFGDTQNANVIKLKENIKQNDTIYLIRAKGFNNYE